MFKSTEPSNLLLPETGSIIIDTGRSELGEFNGVKNQNSVSAMQPNMNASLELGVSVKVDGGIALDATASFDKVTMSEDVPAHDANIKLIEPQEPQWNISDCERERLEMNYSPSKVELPHEMIQARSAEIQPKCERIEEFAASVNTVTLELATNSDAVTCDKFRENEDIPHESEIDAPTCSGSPRQEVSIGIKEYSPANGDFSETQGSILYTKQNNMLLRDDDCLSPLGFGINSSTNEDAKHMVEEEDSAPLENESQNFDEDNIVSRDNIANEVVEKPEGENRLEKDAEVVDNDMNEEMIRELSRNELAASAEAAQSTEPPESWAEESKVVKPCGNESMLINASDLTDNQCKKSLTGSSRKDAAESEDDIEKEEGELEEGELDDDNDEEKKDFPDTQTCQTGSQGSASDEEDKPDSKKVSDVDEKKRKKKLDGEEEPRRKKKKRDPFYEDVSEDFRKHSDYEAMLEQYRRQTAGEEDEPPFKGPGYDELGRHKRRLDGRPPLLLHSKAEALCVPFLEGTCNKGNECQYSHNMNHSMIMQPHQRKMELCKFYQMGCCAKKQKCSYMHKDFPCKLYHTGMKCVPSDKCQYSHEPLSHITRSILLKHIEMAPKDILGTFPRLNNTAAQQIIAVTELCRNKRPCDIDEFPGIRDWTSKGFKYVTRAIRAFDRKSRRGQPEPASLDDHPDTQDADRLSPPNEVSLSPSHQDPGKPAEHREPRPRSGAENEEGSGEEDRKHSRSRKRHRREEEESSQGRPEPRHHKHRSDGRSSRHDDRRRQRLLDHHSKRDEARLDEPCGRSAARFDYGGRDDPRMEEPDGRNSSRRRASRWGDDREEVGGSSLSPGSSPNAHRHMGGRGRFDYLDNGESYGKRPHGRQERDRQASRERRGWPPCDDDGRRSRRYGDPGMPPSPQGDLRESSEDDASTAAIAAAVDSIPSMLDSFKRNSSSHQDLEFTMSDRMGSEADRGSNRLMDRNYTVDRSSSRMTNPSSDRFNSNGGDKSEESRSCQGFQGKYDPLEIFRRQHMQESASTREAPILGQSADGTVEYSPYLKNFKKVPSAAVSPVRPTSQHYTSSSGASLASSYEGMSRDRDGMDPRRDSAGSSSKEFRRTPPRSEDEARSSTMVLKLNLNNINVPSDLAQVLSSLKNQTRLPKSDSVPASVSSQSPTSKVSPPIREDFMALRNSPSVQDSPYLKSYRSWSPSTGNQMSKDHSSLMLDPRQRTPAENDQFEHKRSDSMPSHFYQPPETRNVNEHTISDPRSGVKDQTLSNFLDPRLTRGFSSVDQSNRSSRSSSDSDDRSNDPAMDVDLKRLQKSSSGGSFTSEIPFEIHHHEPVTVINASITTNPPMMYRLVEVTVSKVNPDNIKSRFDKDHPRVHEDPRLYKMFFSPDASESRSPGSIVYEDPQSPPPSEVSPSQGSLENRDPRINRDPRVAEARNIDPRINTDPRVNSDPRRSMDLRGNCDPRSRNPSVGVTDPDVRLSGGESPESRGGDPRMGGHTDPRLENRRSDPRLINRDPRAGKNFDEDNTTNAPMAEAYPPSLLGNAPNPVLPFGGPVMRNMGGPSSMGLLNGPPGLAGQMSMPVAGPMLNMYSQNMMNYPSQPTDMQKMPHNMGPSEMNPYSSRYGVGPRGPSMMGPGVGDPSVPLPNSLGQGSLLGMNSNILPAHSLQANWPPASSFQNTDPRLKKN